MIEKNYQPADIESRIVPDLGGEPGAFKAGRPERKDAAPFTIVIPPPNVTGSLHMGQRPEQHPAGHSSLPLRADARATLCCGSLEPITCGHCDPDGGRAAIDGTAGTGPPRDGPRQIPRTGLAIEGRERRRHRQSAETPRRVLRLVARTIYDGRGSPLARGRSCPWRCTARG